MLDAKSKKRKANQQWRDAAQPAGPFRPALTLIELLVVITILTTLVAGVIPILSPNNDVRKIREASRAVQNYITIAQAEAARTGRPHGIGFVESAPGSGVALEVFQLEVPQAFAGFSNFSRVRIANSSLPLYTHTLQFIYGDSPTTDPFPLEYVQEPLPPNFLRRGDIVEVDGVRYQITDLDQDGDGNPEAEADFPQGDFYTFDNQPNPASNPITIQCNYLSSTRPLLSLVAGGGTATAPKEYRNFRQPANSPEPPLALPRGVGIDMVASGIEGGTLGGFTFLFNTYGTPAPSNSSFYDDTLATFATPQINSVGMMFAPSGRIERVYLNGAESDSVAKVMLLLGRVENASVDPTDPNFSLSASVSDSDLESRRETINWLNLDSRWISISANNGRMVGTANTFVDPRQLSAAQNNDPVIDQVAEQLFAARQYAREMRREGGR
ncbi:pilus assembly FimT family protein [Adhaeretor mobilis]|uniref:Prepilin-type N-terminal cleavage/methylation domain-containing protein n=1 Tax=Adhaeretor mobilis TaxID=1930276 RepID=A0A517MT16_9BACT|nr:type II secretion system protein [Adhaeretor mobilis]QDS98026.1 hypothetical protein HG15A2_12960 [Adhaeretor mobilis]